MISALHDPAVAMSLSRLVTALPEHNPEEMETMRIRILLQTLVVIGAVGLLLEIAGGHTWLVIAAA